ncbi:hypothetical protein ASJ81_12990 [Methanosarcina spelaei]|uniref:Uncharacterized protein n=1 Tax=Methanosarcina spelaei TaxID=1036679 RepID=A0A2A2HMK8_9EURY|nr:hypothetical protein [Methanosarcina spelaei]PAV10612.1 hypothetical protein ASJ81_12990 [Methanosarcina spelaei]
METLKLRIETTEKALKTLKAITEEPYSVIVRDAAIQRFEYTSETFIRAFMFQSRRARENTGLR